MDEDSRGGPLTGSNHDQPSDLSAAENVVEEAALTSNIDESRKDDVEASGSSQSSTSSRAGSDDGGSIIQESAAEFRTMESPSLPTNDSDIALIPLAHVEKIRRISTISSILSPASHESTSLSPPPSAFTTPAQPSRYPLRSTSLDPPQINTDQSPNVQIQYTPALQYLRQVSNLEFSKAVIAQKPKLWTAQMIKLYVVLLAGFLNSCINGYDGSVMGGINAMEQYQSYFHMKRLGSGTGIVFMIYTIGNMVGSFITGPIADSWGRRWGMFSGSAIVIVGATVQGMSKNRGAFLAGRFILGFGASITTTSGPTYVAEMAHPAWRGPLTGLYNTFYFVGAIMAAWVMYGTQSIDSDVSWRLPILLQTLAAGLVLVSILFCPETPRWLVSNDHNEEAIRVLTRYFGEGNRKSPIVLLSYREMVQEIILYGSDKRWWDFSELWSTHGARRRLLCVAGMAFFGQWSGNGAVQNYMPVLMDRVGIASRNLQLLNNAILYVVNFFVSIAGALLVDKVGRRPMLLFGTAMFVVWWLIISVMTKFYAHAGSSDDDAHGEEVVLQDFNVHGAKATVAMIFLFSITHSFSYTSLQVLYPVECLKYETRAKGMGVYSLLVNFASLFNSFGMAVVIERIGWGFCVIYIVWDVIEFICIYLFFVETKNRTLEEINEIFVAPNPKEKSLEQHVLVVTDRDLLWDQSLISSEGNDLAERHPMPDGDDAAEMGDWGSQGKVPRIEVTQPGGE